MLVHKIYIIGSYITNRLFRVKQDGSYSELKEIHAGVPQGSVLGPLLYVLYTCDIPQPREATIATFADDTAILSVGDNAEAATKKLQNALEDINTWTKIWKIKLNKNKSVHIDFTNKKNKPVQLVMSNCIIPYANTAKYLGMNLDAKLRWKEHIKKKGEEIKIRTREMNWLIGRKSKLPIHNKILLYNQIIKPIWMYGIQLWGCAKKSNRCVIQRKQNNILRCMVDAPWYVRNSIIHKDLGIPEVDEEIKKIAKRHDKRLQDHPNLEARSILQSYGFERRLKRTKTFELFE